MQDDWGANDTGGQDDGFLLSTPGRKRFHLSLFVYALLGSALGALIGWAIYRGMYDSSGSNVIMVGLILAIISALVLLACALCELCKPRITINQELNLPRILTGLLVTVVVFIAGCLCEFIYEWNSAYTAVTFDDFIFAIDDSGSMSATDPMGLRYSALEELLDSLDGTKRAGLVRFNETVYAQPIDLGELDDEQRTRLREGIAVPCSVGGTDIYQALAVSLNMHQGGARSGQVPVVVLLSDGRNEGASSGGTLSGTIRAYLNAGVAVSTVSLGGNTDEALLQNLAQSTGGQYFKVQQAGDLAQAFQQVSTAVTYRCLFSPRPGSQRGSVLYIILRVLFLLFPGLLIGFFILLLLQSGLVTRQLLVSGAAGLLAALVMEMGTYFFLPLTVTHTVSWILYGVVLLQYYDSASGLRQSKLETSVSESDWRSGWDDFSIESGMSEITRREGGRGGRIDRRDDWGRL